MPPGKRVPIPEFGTRKNGLNYIDRPGAYAIIENSEKRIAVIKAGKGYFLPGGGLEPGETDTDALKREILEEIGYQASIFSDIGEAIEYIKAAGEEKYYQIRGKFYLVQLGSKVSEGIEKDHRLVWLGHKDAIRLLTRQSQAWAVRKISIQVT